MAIKNQQEEKAGVLLQFKKTVTYNQKCESDVLP